MRGFRCAAIFFAVLLGCSWGGRQTVADVTLVTDQATYNQETSGLTTINFSQFAPPGSPYFTAYDTSTGLVSGPVDFVGPLSSGTWQGGNYFLTAVNPLYFPSYNAYPNSPTVLEGPPGAGSPSYGITGTLNVTLGGNYSAVGSGLYVVQTGNPGTASGTVEIAVTDLSGTYDFTITTSGTFINFAGFLSNSQITSLQYITQDVEQFPTLSNFSYGSHQITSVPEPSSLVLAGSVAAVLLARVALRKLRPQGKLGGRKQRIEGIGHA
jgi:PEP-CTERM motif